MRPIVPYLFFAGNCREAMNFYREIFGGELKLSTYGDAPESARPGGDPKRIMHAHLKSGALEIMASDPPEGSPGFGDNVQLSAFCDSAGDVDRIFGRLTAEGEAKVAPHEAFFGNRFGMCVDRLGVHWLRVELTPTIKRPFRDRARPPRPRGRGR